MSANHYIDVGVLINSCMIGANAYRVLSDEAEFQECYLEPITDTIRQRPGHRYMRACTELDKTELWMVPFSGGAERLLTLQDAMEHVYCHCLGVPHFRFPIDVVEETGCTALVLRPFDREATCPFRKYLPNADAPRWHLARNLFERVAQLHKMGLTSNGISREQLRVDETTWEVELLLNQTMKLIKSKGVDMRHEGFGTIPSKTEKTIIEHHNQITGVQRDIFSAAVWAFYLIMFTHPFVGSSFRPLSRDEYLTRFLYAPAYIMEPDGDNRVGNQPFDRLVEEERWGNTVPELKALFDGIFMAVTDPVNHWKGVAPWWDINNWLAALEADAKKNDNPQGRSRFNFDSQLHRLA